MVVGRKEYACTLRGVAMQARDGWLRASESWNADDADIMSGRCQAYAAILTTITGEPAREGALERWDDSIKAM